MVNIKDYGYNLYPFTEVTQLHLLPIANKPALAYLLEKLISHYFTDFIFICNHVNWDSIHYYIKNIFEWPENMNVQYQFYNAENYQDITESLAHLYKDEILTKDFLLIKGDCITECNFNDLVDYHYLNSYTITSVYSE